MSKNIVKKSAERERVVNSTLAVFTNKYMNGTLKLFGRFFVFAIAITIFSFSIFTFSNTQVYAEGSFVFTNHLELGVVSNDVKELQTLLNAQGYNVGIPDGKFGPSTKAQVILFQKANGLTPDGIIGEGVRAFLNGTSTITPTTKTTTTPKVTTITSTTPVSLNRTLKLVMPRMNGDDVKALQTFLNNLGYNTGTPDGSFGPKTEAQVKFFQIDNNLTPDGKAGKNTLAVISQSPVSNSNSTNTQTKTSGCNSSLGFSTTTGKSCTTISLSTGCNSTSLFSITTGLSCGIISLPTGCTSTSLFSTTSGVSCITGLPSTPVIKYSGGGSSGSSISIISTRAISGVTIPAGGATPTSSITSTGEYTVSIIWDGNPTIFSGNTSYTAVITIIPKSHYTLTGVTADFFTVVGATATNAVNTGVVTAVFPASTLTQLTISNPTLTLTKAYNGNNSAVVTASTLGGVVNSEDVTVTATATYDTKTVGTNKTITVTYTLGSGDATKYTKPVDYTVAIGIITPIQLTIANPTLTTQKEYDRTTTAQVTAGALSGVVDGGVTVSAVANYDTLNRGEAKMITIVYSLSGVNAGNYIKPVDRISYSGIITTKQLTIASPSITLSKTYDRNTSAVITAGALTGVAGTEDVSVSAVATYDNADVATSKTITTVYTISGADAANYIKPINDTNSSGVITALQLTIVAPTLTTTKVYDNNTIAAVTVGELIGVISPDIVTVTGDANYADANVGTNKIITTVYTLADEQAGNYTKPVNDINNTGVIIAIVINTATISGVTAPVAGATPVATLADGTGYTATIAWSPVIATFAPVTVYTATVTLTPKTGYTLTGVTANFFTVAGTSTPATNSADSGIVSAVFPITITPPATAPSSITLAVGSTAPVGGVTNVAIPAPGTTDSTGAVTGWITGTADKIAFTVTDTAPATSTITIGGAGYTSGADYPIPGASPLTIIVTTSEDGKLTAVRTFTVTVAAPVLYALRDTGPGGGLVFYITDGGLHGLEVAPTDQSTGIQWAIPAYQSTSVGGTSTDIGTGSANTDLIIIQNGAGTTYAAGLAHAYNGGTKSDWFLPSKDELYKMYINLKSGTDENSVVYTPVGGFTSSYDWSSSEKSATNVWDQGFFNGYQTDDSKNGDTLYVRAVRAF